MDERDETVSPASASSGALCSSPEAEREAGTGRGGDGARARGPEPYYEHDGVTIYHGDALSLLPVLEADVLITDPPYGVDLGQTKGSGGKHGLSLDAYETFSDSYDDWLSLVPAALETALDRTKRGAVFTGPHINEQRKADALGGVYCRAGAGRHRWGFKVFLPVLFYGTAPNLHLGAKGSTVHESTKTARPNGHPVPKPLDWMLWLVSLASTEDETVLDPFMGSGTTLLAAKRLGRRAIGIEIEERYCEIAAKRLSQGELFGLEIGGSAPRHNGGALQAHGLSVSASRPSEPNTR